VLPAVSSLRALRRIAGPTLAAKPFLGVGDPALNNSPGCNQEITTTAGLFRGGAVNVDAVRQLCALPETGEELRALARSQGASPVTDVYLGARATLPQVESLPLASYRVIAFATHGLTAGDVKNLAEPALVLTPPARASADDAGLLTASEVARLRLDADWVILSACNTAAGEGPDAEGLSGLAKAFFYAGARALLVSHWPVESAAAVELTTNTLSELRDHPAIGRAEALRRAEMNLLDHGELSMANPAAWAPFSLLGIGSEQR
jgi:CHAT domain-containing protein